ncbi:MAG TPA: VTT domain-containing protein [Rudaea sp.]
MTLPSVDEALRTPVRDDVARERRRLALTVGAVLALVALAIVWFATPLREWIDVARIAQFLGRFRDSPFAPLVMIALFVAGGFVVVPVNVLIAATVLVFGPVAGIAYALIGCELNAIALYEVGRRLPHGPKNGRLATRVRRLRARVAEHGVLAVALVRIVPIAPYSIVNVVAGAAHVDRVRYAIGTALGMLPGIVVNALFIDRILAAIDQPGPWSIALLAAVAAIAVAFALFVRRRLARRIG